MKLVVKNMGHVPSFKNRKRAILDRKTGKLRTLTERKTARWMERCTNDFVSQLHSMLATVAAAMGTEHCPRSLIASLLPLDDGIAWIPEIHLHTVYVDPGDEGAEIEIEMML